MAITNRKSTLIGIGLFLFTLIVGFFLIQASNPLTINGKLSDGSARYVELENKNGEINVRSTFESEGGPIAVFFVKSHEDFKNFIEDEPINDYKGCEIVGYSGEITCKVSTGGIVVYNLNDDAVTYSLTYEYEK